MKRLCILASLAALAGCAPAIPATSAHEATDGLAPVASLAGEYRIAGIDGKPVDAPFGLVLSITAQRIAFDSPCNGFAWDYRLEGKRLHLVQTVRPDPSCLAAARIHHVVFDAASAIDAATTAGRDPSNAVVLAGGGKSLTLYSQ